jgi:hypothetical protein
LIIHDILSAHNSNTSKSFSGESIQSQFVFQQPSFTEKKALIFALKTSHAVGLATAESKIIELSV